MKITFEVDENFVEYYEDFGWSKNEIKKHCKDFVEKVLLEQVDDNDDFVFMTKFDDYLQDLQEED
jgi:hypothetical protein